MDATSAAVLGGQGLEQRGARQLEDQRWQRQREDRRREERTKPRRIDAERAQLDASSKYTARIEREAQAEPEAARQADMSCEMDR